MPEPIDPTFFASPPEFRAWLKKHHRSASMLWVGYHKKATGKPSVTWPETVDEALCYGWIDGVRRSLGVEAYAVRFTPRKPKSVWSARNIARVEALEAAGRMRKAGRDAYAHKNANPLSGYAVSQQGALPDAMIATFEKHAEAWAFYQAQPPSYRKHATLWVTSAKREDTRARRLATLIDDSAQGLRIKQMRRK